MNLYLNKYHALINCTSRDTWIFTLEVKLLDAHSNSADSILLYVLTSFIYLFKIYSIKYVSGPGFHTVQILPHFSIIKSLSVQFSSVAQSCSTLFDSMDWSMPGLPVHRQLPEFCQTHVHRVSDAIQPSHPLSSPSPPTFNLSQHQGLFQWVSSSHQEAKVLEFQFQHQSFQWIRRTDFL